MAYRYQYKQRRKPKRLILAITYILIFSLGFLFSYYIYLDQEPEVIIREIPASEVMVASSNIVAVSQAQNLGLVGQVEVTISDGNGLVLINTNPFLEPDTQYSATIAVEIAKNYTNIDLSNKNVIFDFNIGEDVLVVGGPSAGASMTIAAIAAMEDKETDNNIVITGTINADGTIGQVGGIIEKAQASAGYNKTLFLVPKGQSIATYYEKEIKQEKIGSFIISRVNYVPRKLDLNEYAKENWNLEIKEVENISEVVQYMIE